jgi:hypothetical protein
MWVLAAVTGRDERHAERRALLFERRRDADLLSDLLVGRPVLAIPETLIVARCELLTDQLSYDRWADRQGPSS